MLDVEPPQVPVDSLMHINYHENQNELIFDDKDSQDNQENKEIEDEGHFQKMCEEKMEKEIKHASRPLWVSTMIVKYPIIMLLVTVMIYIIFSVIVLSTNVAKIGNSYYRDYLVWGDTIVNQFDSMQLFEEDLNQNYLNGEQPIRTTRMSLFATQILFECDDCSTILTVDNVKQMHEVEQIMINDPNYVNF